MVKHFCYVLQHLSIICKQLVLNILLFLFNELNIQYNVILMSLKSLILDWEGKRNIAKRIKDVKGKRDIMKTVISAFF